MEKEKTTQQPTETEEAVQTENKKPSKRMPRPASYISKIAMFSALAFVLRLLRFPMPFMFPSWFDLHFADFPALICGFALGPVAGCVVTVVSVLLKILAQYSATAFVGDLANVVTGIALVLPASLIYKFNRTKKGAFIGAVVGGICSTVIAVPANIFVLVPFYAKTFGFEAVLGMYSALIPSVTEESFYTLYTFASVVPFNLLRCICVCALTFISYKSISRLLGKF